MRPVEMQGNENQGHLAQVPGFARGVQNLVGQIVHLSQGVDHLQIECGCEFLVEQKSCQIAPNQLKPKKVTLHG